MLSCVATSQLSPVDYGLKMAAIGGGNGGIWGKKSNSKSSFSVKAVGISGINFPLKQAVTAGSLALIGDTIAQVREHWRRRKSSAPPNPINPNKDVTVDVLANHDWLRALRMSSYGFLFYGPGSYAWYRFLDHCLPEQTAKNLFIKVLLNQIVLGPCVIAVVFAWNNLWQGRISELPKKYQRDALPTLLYGFRFWIPVSILNFWVVPLQARVAFMCLGSIFWNFYLSSTMSK